MPVTCRTRKFDVFDLSGIQSPGERVDVECAMHRVTRTRMRELKIE